MFSKRKTRRLLAVVPGSGSSSSRETFVDRDFRSECLLQLESASAGLQRSASSAGTSKSGRAPIAKPVRRSKSQLQRTTTIQHGGPITFVSVNNNNNNSSGGDKSHTLPRDVWVGFQAGKMRICSEFR